jgi:hypothetical protein
MKICRQCEIQKPFGDFYKRKASPDGYQFFCKLCANKKTVASEHKSIEKYQEIRSKRYKKFRDETTEYKVSRGCQHCGENHPAVLDLHHLDPSVKDMDPSAASGRRLFYEEASKCIVLCSNCHRKEHYRLKIGE